jgi:protoporphyrinogen oxidase
MNLIIGGGLAGLSCAYHLGHSQWTILEQRASLFGHAGSERVDGFTWDQGPHVSFTKHEYVRDLFARSVDGQFEEFPVRVANHYLGAWIDHPAQTSLHQVPEPLRSECLAAFLASRNIARESAPADYGEWLREAFGSVFASTFPAAYTRKYWTVEPEAMTTDWLGGRVLNPDVETVLAGACGPLPRSTHYISTVRYPLQGGYQSFARSMAAGVSVRYGARVSRIDLARRQLRLASGERLDYDSLVNTMPLPEFIDACEEVPLAVREAAEALCCTQLMLVNVGVPCASPRPEHWIYVYDEDLLSTRLSFTDKLSRGNAPGPGWSGVQAEVYASRYRPFADTPAVIGERVLDELVGMGVLPGEARSLVESGRGRVDVRLAPWANVVFLHDTRSALETIWRWLERFGLVREADDTDPLTDWNAVASRRGADLGEAALCMAGRFGQWKYFWSDDCVLRGRHLAGVRGEV